jgi:hypothetical protein
VEKSENNKATFLIKIIIQGYLDERKVGNFAIGVEEIEGRHVSEEDRVESDDLGRPGNLEVHKK